MYAIKMPDIGEGIAEVKIVQWHVKPGDVVAEEQLLAAVMTDKANVEIPSNVAGKVIALNGKPGDVIAVGTEIIRLEVEGKGNVLEAVSAPAPQEAPPSPKPSPSPSPQPSLSRTASLASPHPEPEPVAQERPLAAPAVRRRAREL